MEKLDKLWGLTCRVQYKLQTKHSHASGACFRHQQGRVSSTAVLAQFIMESISECSLTHTVIATRSPGDIISGATQVCATHP